MKTIVSITILVVLLPIAFLNLSRDYEMTIENTCLPENQNNKRVVDKAITDPVWSDIWSQLNLTGITPNNIEYVTSNDSKCESLLVNYSQWIYETHPNTNLKVYTVTFHKYGNNYFVLLLLNQHPNMAVFGASPFYILDHNLNLIEGLGM